MSIRATQERAAEQLVIHFRARLVPIFTFSPLPKRGSGMDTTALCGWKGGSIAKANCGLSSGGGANGRHRVSLPGCAGSCLWDRADLTCLGLNTLLQHDLHRIAVLEHLVLPQLSC